MTWVLTAIGAYVIGSFPSSRLAGIIWGGVDIRKRGTNNPGALNAYRVLGPLPAFLVFLLDAGKGALAVILPSFYFGPAYGWLGGLMAIVGHIHPPYTRFRGGKGLSTSCGAALLLEPWLILVFVAVWAVFYLWRKKIALSSAASALATVITAIFILPVWPLIAAVLAMAAVFWRHWPEVKADLTGKKASTPVS